MRVNGRSVLRWVKAGLLPAYRTGGGRWRIRRPDLVRFMRDRAMDVPPTLVGGGPARVLIVDDDENHVSAVRAHILDVVPDAEVEVAYEGFSAGLLAAQSRPHLVLLDLVMPGLDGAEVCRRIRRTPALDATTVVVISGVLDDAKRDQLAALGASLCLTKPVEPSALDDLLQRFLPNSEGPDARPDPS